MDKKYQVFISSTYTDLVEERKKVLELLLMADCIPAGMEAFVATDDEQFNVIKKVIDLCDYYVLIIGNRYGSINEATGLSYTEMEYEYALSKEIPVLVFALENSAIEDSSNTEDVIKQGKLAEFKKKALNNRLASVWKDIGDLSGKVAISIMRAKQEISRPGWVRDNGYNQTDLLKQILDLQNQNEELKNRLEECEQDTGVDESLPFYGYKIKLHYTERCVILTANTIIHEVDIETTLDELFKFISLRLTGVHNTKDFIDAVSSFKSGYYVESQQALVVKNQYIQLGLLKQSVDKKNNEMLELTDKGIRVMNELNALK